MRSRIHTFSIDALGVTGYRQIGAPFLPHRREAQEIAWVTCAPRHLVSFELVAHRIS
ncbi:MAG: hypothetical protein ACXWYO_01505 [Gaiellaceae bacterium]